MKKSTFDIQLIKCECCYVLNSDFKLEVRWVLSLCVVLKTNLQVQFPMFFQSFFFFFRNNCGVITGEKDLSLYKASALFALSFSDSLLLDFPILATCSEVVASQGASTTEPTSQHCSHRTPRNQKGWVLFFFNLIFYFGWKSKLAVRVWERRVQKPKGGRVMSSSLIIIIDIRLWILFV